jgi:dual specificity MAP kinase phosphatase
MDYSQITESLYIGTTPRPEDYSYLRQLGVQLVINMRFEQRPHPDQEQPPIHLLWLPSVDSPLVPISIRKLQRGVQEALATIQKGGKVYVHCAKGRHRGPAMGAAILIALGYSPDYAMQIIEQRRCIASPRAWYIRRRIQRFAKTWHVS